MPCRDAQGYAECAVLEVVRSRELLSPEHSQPPIGEELPQRVVIVTHVATVGTELERLVAREGCDVVLLDEPESLLRVPDLSPDVLLPYAAVEDQDSFEWCADLRSMEAFRHVPILLVTDRRPDPDWVAAALLSGADDVCPVSDDHRAELRARLRVQLRNQRYRDAIARLRAERNNLRARAATDALTGTLGRRALEDAVQTEFALGRPFAVLFGDVDHFKSVNDTFGHQMGDEVLKRVAATLSLGRRAGDACGRYGGEEFVLILRQVNAEQALRVAERHRNAVSRLRFEGRRAPSGVTMSFGVAAFDPDAPDPSMASLLARADHALYRAKAGGRNRVVMAKPMPAPPSSGRLAPHSNQHPTIP